MAQVRRGLASVSLGTLLWAAAAVGSAAAQGVPVGDVAITGFTHAGAGCPDGSVAQNLSPDAQAITVLYSSYQVEAGPLTADHRKIDQKTCNMTFAMHTPSDWSFTLFQLDTRGYAEMTGDGQGVALVKYAFGSNQLINLGQQRLKAPVANDYAFSVDAPLVAASWSACGTPDQTLAVTTVLQVQGTSGEAAMTVDSLDGHVEHQYGLQWRRCADVPPPPPNPAVLVLRPQVFRFGTVRAGGSAVLAGTLVNVGGAPAHLSGGSEPASPFNVSFGTCPSDLAPQQQCNVQVGFAPQSAGSYSGHFAFTYLDGSGHVPSVAGTVSGTGAP